MGNFIAKLRDEIKDVFDTDKDGESMSSDEASDFTHSKRQPLYGIPTVKCRFICSAEKDSCGSDQILENFIQEEMTTHYKEKVQFTSVKSDDPDVNCTIIISPITDVNQTLKDLKCNKDMVLVAIHHIAPHVELKQRCVDVLTDAEKSKALGAVVDVVFDPVKRFYEGLVNDEAYKGVYTFIVKRAKPIAGTSSHTSKHTDSEKTKSFIKLPEALLKVLEPKKKVCARVSCRIISGSLNLGDKLCEVLQNKMKSHHQTEVEFYSSNENGQDVNCTIVLCPITSRLGSNVNHALRDLKCNKDMVLVAVHHIAPHVPLNHRSEDVLTDEKSNALGAIVDVVFHTEKGLYECDVNRRALDRLCQFLSEKKTKPRPL